MARLTKSDLFADLGIMAVGFALGAIVAYLLPIIGWLVSPAIYGWCAGGGVTKSTLLNPRQAAAFGIGTSAATTLIMTFTLGWDRTDQEWIVYSLLGTATLYWVAYAGMYWLHQPSASAPIER